MYRIFLMTFMVYGSIHAMKKPNIRTSPKATELQKAQTFADQAHQEALLAFKVDNKQGNVAVKHLRKAGVCAQLALKFQVDNTGQLAAIDSLDRAVQALEKDDYDKVAAQCFTILDNDKRSLLLDRIRIEAFNLMKILSDKKHYTPARFYVMKRYLSSTDSENMKIGLDRYDDLDTSHMPVEHVKSLGTFFEYFEIIDDLKRIAHDHKNPQAQCALAESHLFQAERGENMQGKAIVVKEELDQALALAKSAKKAGYLKANSLIRRIRQSSHDLYQDAKIDMPLMVVDPSKPIPSVMKDALNLLRIAYTNDHAQLYALGKRLVNDHSLNAQVLGHDFLKDSFKLGNPFAGCLLGDIYLEKDSRKALLHYYKALHIFKSAPVDTHWHTIGKFASQSLERHISTLINGEIKDLYADAKNAALTLLMHKEMHTIDSMNEQDTHDAAAYVLSTIDSIAQELHEREAEFVQTQSTIDTLELEMLANSGMLACLDRLKEYQGIQAVLIEALSLRGKLGRGFILHDKDPKAHLEKALHFIIDPESAVQTPLNAPVPKNVLTQLVNVDSLPTQHGILYMHDMLNLLERIIMSESHTVEEAKYACSLFSSCAAALVSTKDENLKRANLGVYGTVISCMAPLALKTDSIDCLDSVGSALFKVCTSSMFGLKHIDDALKIYSALALKYDVAEAKGALKSVEKKIGTLKKIQAELAMENGAYDLAYELYGEARQYQPDNTDLLWQQARLLLGSHNIELRKQGFESIKKLADIHKQYDAVKYMARAHCDPECEFITPELDKAIVYHKLLVEHDGPKVLGSRESLALIYLEKASRLADLPKKRLLAKAHDLIVPFKRLDNKMHILFLNVLQAMGRSREIAYEIDEFSKEKATSEMAVCALATEYMKRISNINDSLRTPLLKKVIQLTTPLIHTNEVAYVRLLQGLFANDQLDVLKSILAIETSSNIECIKKSIEASMMLLEDKGRNIEQVLHVFDQAYDAYQEQFERKPLTDTADLVEMLQAQQGYKIAFIRPWQTESLLELEGVPSVLKELVKIDTLVDATLKKSLLAYCGYMLLKINILKCGMKQITHEKLVDQLGKMVETYCKVDSVSLKNKIMNEIGKCLPVQIDVKTSESFKDSIACILQLLKLGDTLYSSSDDNVLQQSYGDMLKKVDALILSLDCVKLNEQDKLKIGVVQKIVAQYSSKLKK